LPALHLPVQQRKPASENPRKTAPGNCSGFFSLATLWEESLLETEVCRQEVRFALDVICLAAEYGLRTRAEWIPSSEIWK
jgi:hypothetical protein